ncbi:MAG: DUF5302 domain-containing protein [Mycobacterium sp.]
MAESKSPKDAEQDAEPSGSDDETKRKFRAALDRKMAKSSGGSDHKDGGGKQPRAHGPLESRREFRRKSG